MNANHSSMVCCLLYLQSPPLLYRMSYVTAQFRKHKEGVAGFLKEASRSDKHGKKLAAICEGIVFIMTFVYAREMHHIRAKSLELL